MVDKTESNVKETLEISRSQFVTLNEGVGRGHNIKYKPHVFTEQGIYMLMTVLKADLAYSQIYERAQKSIYVVDNYIGVKKYFSYIVKVT